MPVWQVLIGNLTSVALIISLWAHISYKFYRLSKSQLKFYFGITLGCCVIASMLLSVPLMAGLFFDLRVSLLLISAVFGGPLSLAITALSAAVFRLFLGGIGATPALIGIALTSAAGLGLHFFLRRLIRRGVGLLALGLFSAALSVALLAMLPTEMFHQALQHIAWPVALLNFFTTMVVGFGIGYFTKFTLERDILRASLTQAPDFHYVKNLDSRFVVTNLNVARHHGRQKSSEMVGLSDFDLAPDRAAALFEAEQDLIATGEPVIDKEEMLLDPEGLPRWFTTSKVVLRNRHGDTIGLTGVTRDITHRKSLEEQLISSRNLMSQAMAEMSDGLAMFDPKGILVLCNEQYSAFFPRSAYARKPGAHISEIVRAVVRNGERKDVASNASEEWIQNAALNLHANKDEEIPLFDGRWLSMRTRLSQDGSSLVVVSDISASKASEQSLQQLANHMRGLAQTDGLTGLANRRTFDEVIAKECTRSVRTGAPLTLLLVDVDRFKAYNDMYGHQAGDLCLQQVSACLAKTGRRPSDLVARYGGEEFAILLPETSAEDGRELAERFHSLLQDLNLAHAGSEFGIVTASVGIASIAGGNAFLNPTELIGMADASLYAAKHQGRNCTGTIPPAWRQASS